MSIHEHDYEPVRGLPGILPAGEKMLWQGSPKWLSVLVHVLHVRWIAGYFAFLVAWRFAAALGDGMTLLAAITSALWLMPLWLGVIAMMALYAWGIARTTIYTITTKRLVMRQGVALEMAVNVPFSQVVGADVRDFGDGTGQIPLTLDGEIRLAYLVIWPHAQIGHFMNPRPMLRSIADPHGVGQILAAALRDCLQPTISAPTPVRVAKSRPVDISATIPATAA